MIDFWRTDSERCVARLGTVKELLNEFRSEGFHVISIVMNPADKDKLRLIRQRHKLPFPLVQGASTYNLDPWLLNSLPVSYIHDRDGRVRSRIVGSQGKEVYEEQIKALLDGSQDLDTIQP